MKRSQSLFFVLGVLALLSLVSACGDSSDSAATTVAPTTTTAATTTTVAPTTTTAATTTTVAPTTTTAATTTTVAPTTTQPAAEGQVPTESGDVPRVTVEELNQRLADGDQILVVDAVDLSGTSSYDNGHIPGAVQVTTDYLDGISHDQEIILYCA